MLIADNAIQTIQNITKILVIDYDMFALFTIFCDMHASCSIHPRLKTKIPNENPSEKALNFI